MVEITGWALMPQTEMEKNWERDFSLFLVDNKKNCEYYFSFQLSACVLYINKHMDWLSKIAGPLSFVCKMFTKIIQQEFWAKATWIRSENTPT